MKKISVCIPVYNAEPYIRVTIESVLAQDYENMEILVSDNCSEDKTLEVVRSIEDERIRVFEHDENVGMAGNWNRLIELADGDYFNIVCADDLLPPGVFSLKAKILDEHPDVDIVSSASAIIDENGKELMQRHPFKKDKRLNGKRLAEYMFTHHNLLGEPNNNMLRTSAVKAMGGFDPDLWYAVDWEGWTRILMKGNCYYTNQIGSYFRISTTSATGSNISKKDRIYADDERFIQALKDKGTMELTDQMIRAHRRQTRIRLFERNVFMKLIAVRGKLKG